MREVISNLAWIGHARDARNVARVLDLGIKAVIDLAIDEPAVPFPRDITYGRFPLCDGAGNEDGVLLAAITTTRILVEATVPTLVFCGAGMSRSPAIVAAAIAIMRDIDLDAALRIVAEAGPHDVSPALWSDVRRLVDRPR